MTREVEDYELEVVEEEDDNDDDSVIASPYAVNPHIQITETILEKEHEHYKLGIWKITGLIDMDGRFFDHSGNYRLFMGQKSFTMYMNGPLDIDRMKINFSKVKTLHDLISLSATRITFHYHNHL